MFKYTKITENASNDNYNKFIMCKYQQHLSKLKIHLSDCSNTLLTVYTNFKN